MTRPPTGGTRGQIPKSIEEKRRIGNPGRKPLPKPGTLIMLAGTTEPPEPPRMLGTAGRAVWNRVWNAGALWLARDVDPDCVLLLCEQIDERQQLRSTVLRHEDWRERAALRGLEAQIMAGLATIGFNPVERNRMQVAEVAPPSKLEMLLTERQGRVGVKPS